MINDEVIDEIRAVRHRLSEECGHDVERFCEHLREVAARHPEQIARFHSDDNGVANFAPHDTMQDSERWRFCSAQGLPHCAAKRGQDPAVVVTERKRSPESSDAGGIASKAVGRQIDATLPANISAWTDVEVYANR